MNEIAYVDIWQTCTQLLFHQTEAVAKLLPARVGALFMEMGTGKSRVAIELAKIRQEKIDRVIWACPVSLRDTVRYEIAKHTGNDCQTYVFDDKTNETNVRLNAFWYIVGLESISGSARVVCTFAQLVTERSFVIVDESSYIKGHRAKRTERLILLCEKARYRLILTGTPISQGIQDLYAQMKFLSPKILGYKSWYSFARNHLEYSEKFKGMIVRTHNLEFIAAKIKPYVYQVTKAECLTLPKKLYHSRILHLTDEQAEAYAEAKEIYLTEALMADEFDSISIFRLFTALQAIVCGFWTKPDGEKVQLAHNRLDRLADVLQAIANTEKVVIWAKYHHCIRQIGERLKADYGSESVCQFHGLNINTRQAELARWRDSGRFLIITQSAGGHGMTLNESHHAVFYANGFKYAERLQAEDRNHRIGQHFPVTYIDLHCIDTIDDRIAKALASKGNAVEQFRREVDKVKKSHKDKLKALVRSL